MGDHRHGDRGLHEAAVLGGDGARPGGAQGVRAGGVEREVVDGPELDPLAGAAEGGFGDGAGEGDAAQFRAAVGEAGRGLVAGEQSLVEVDGGQVAEAGDDDVEEFAGGGLQVEGVADAGAGLVEQGEVAPGGGGLAGGPAAGGDVGAEPGHADGPAGTAVHAVEVDGPVAAFLRARHEARDVHVRDRVAGLQDPAQGRGDPVGLAARQVVVDALAAVVVGVAAEDRGEALVGAAHPQVGVDQQEAEG